MGILDNFIPKVDDWFYPQDETGRVLKIIEVEGEIQDGPFIGRSITADDGVSYDCFWSPRNQRFQYFPDDQHSDA